MGKGKGEAKGGRTVTVSGEDSWDDECEGQGHHTGVTGVPLCTHTKDKKLKDKPSNEKRWPPKQRRKTCGFREEVVNAEFRIRVLTLEAAIV